MAEKRVQDFVHEALAVAYRKDGVEYFHEFEPGAVIVYVRPGVLEIVGTFRVTKRGIEG